MPLIILHHQIYHLSLSLSLSLWVWWEFRDVMLSLRTTSISPDPPGGLRVCTCVLSSTVCIFWDITERRKSGRGYLNRATERDYSICMQFESALLHFSVKFLNVYVWTRTDYSCSVHSSAARHCYSDTS